MILHQCNIIMVPYGDDSILSCNMLMVASRGVYFSFTNQPKSKKRATTFTRHVYETENIGIEHKMLEKESGKNYQDGEAGEREPGSKQYKDNRDKHEKFINQFIHPRDVKKEGRFVKFLNKIHSRKAKYKENKEFKNRSNHVYAKSKKKGNDKNDNEFLIKLLEKIEEHHGDLQETT